METFESTSLDTAWWLAVTGWLSPDGYHYRCGWSDHDVYARRKLGKSTAELEGAGWCRVTRFSGKPEALFARGHEPTEDQAEWLLAHDGMVHG